MKWPAQDHTLATQQAVQMLEDAAVTLRCVASTLELTKPKPKTRVELRRMLSGVLAHVEIVRISIRE